MSDYARYVGGEASVNLTFKKSYVYGLVLNSALGGFFFGYIMSVFNPMRDFVQNGGGFNKQLADIIVNFMTSMVPLGAAIGALSAGKIAAIMGRRRAMMLIDIIALFGTLLTLLPSEYTLLVGRLIQGYCVGANSSLVPLYINEVSPAEVRGTLGTYNQLFISAGVLVAPVIGLGMPTDSTTANYGNQFFRVMLFVAGLPALIRLIILLFIFKSDTPLYLISEGKEDEARELLRSMYDDDRAQTELIALKKLQEEKSKGRQLTLKDLFSPVYSRRLLIGVMIAAFQQFAGINAIIFFSNIIFGGSGITPTLYTVIMDFIQFATNFIAGLVIERFGRRILFIVGMSYVTFLLAAFGLVTLFVSHSPILKFFIWGYMVGFGVSVGPVPWIYISDILPDVGIGIAVLANWVSVFVIGLCFQPLVDLIGMGWSFLIFAITSALGIVFGFIMMKETKDKKPEEIAAMFSSGYVEQKSDLSASLRG